MNYYTNNSIKCDKCNLFKVGERVKQCECEYNGGEEECAICADDYHDSDQYICDDCNAELNALQADQEASRWD